MLGWLFFMLSAYAAYTLKTWFAIANAAVNLWTLGIMHNYADEAGIRDNWERFAIVVNSVTSLIGVGLFVAMVVKQ
jgi:hypothetical protein